MFYDDNVISETKGHRVESNNQRQTNQATTKGSGDQDNPKPLRHFAFFDLTIDTNMFWLVVASAAGSAHGQRDGRCMTGSV
jgi:hypothetical protein